MAYNRMEPLLYFNRHKRFLVLETSTYVIPYFREKIYAFPKLKQKCSVPLVRKIKLQAQYIHNHVLTCHSKQLL